MNTSSNRLETLEALDIALMDALVAGVMGFVLTIIYAWATKEGSPFSKDTWINLLVFRVTLRGVILGGIVGGIVGSIFRPSWGPLVAAIGSIGFWSILEIKPDISQIGCCIGLALIFGLISFIHKMSSEPEQAVRGKRTIPRRSFAMGMLDRLLGKRLELHEAVAEGQMDIVKDLILNGADVNAKDRSGVTPLEVAVNNGHMNIVELLISKGAEVNSKSKGGGTPLDAAAQHGYVDIAQFLISNGADVTAVGPGNITVLHVASIFGQKEIIELLINNGADVNAKSSDGITPLLVVAQIDPDSRPLLGERYGTISKQLAFETAKSLIDRGAELDSKDENKKTALHYAILVNHTELAKLLIFSGANVNGATGVGSTPLLLAAWKGQKDVVDLLISKGADINAKDNDGVTPLYYASAHGHEEVVRLLVSHGADVNSLDNKGIGPLYAAVEYGQKGIVEILVDHGADISARTQLWGGTPLDKAREKGHKEIAEFLKLHSKKKR